MVSEVGRGRRSSSAAEDVAAATSPASSRVPRSSARATASHGPAAADGDAAATSTNRTDALAPRSARGPKTSSAGAPETSSADGPETNSADGPETSSAGAPETSSADGPETSSADAPKTNSADGPEPSSPDEHASPLDELGGYIRHQRESAALSLRKLAKIAGVSNPYLSQIERGLRKPSAEILQAIAKALEISSETLYVKAGILDEREVVIDVEVAVAADPHLTGPQRQALLEMYRSFRRLAELKEPRPSRRRQLLDALTAGDVDDDAIRAAEPPAAPEES